MNDHIRLDHATDGLRGPNRRPVAKIAPTDMAGPAGAMARLQRTIGNHAVNALIQRLNDLSDPDSDDRAVVGLAGGAVSASVARRIEAARSGGSSLDSGAQGRMESALGTSFGDVRIHADSESQALNERLGAVAFTTGRDVFFQSGAYQPGSAEGDRLLAHELTHVVQQRSAPPVGQLVVGPADDGFEAEADAVSNSLGS